MSAGQLLFIIIIHIILHLNNTQRFHFLLARNIFYFHLLPLENGKSTGGTRNDKKDASVADSISDSFSHTHRKQNLCPLRRQKYYKKKFHDNNGAWDWCKVKKLIFFCSYFPFVFSPVHFFL